MKHRRTRIQRLESQLRLARWEINELQEIAYIQGNIQIDQGNRLAQVGKRLDSAVKVNGIEVARLNQKVRVANNWSKALSVRVFRLEQQGFWRKLFGWLPKKVTAGG